MAAVLYKFAQHPHLVKSRSHKHAKRKEAPSLRYLGTHVYRPQCLPEVTQYTGQESACVHLDIVEGYQPPFRLQLFRARCCQPRFSLVLQLVSKVSPPPRRILNPLTMHTENGSEGPNTIQRTGIKRNDVLDSQDPALGQDPGQHHDIRHIIYFLAFTVKESAQQTFYTLLQNFRCTGILLRSIIKAYIDSLRVLVPLWGTTIYAFCLVVLLLIQRLATGALLKVRHTVAN